MESHPIQTLEQIERWFTSHPPQPEDLVAYGNIRRAAYDFVLIICGNCPHSADRSAALRKVREAVMTANAAIALKGQ